MQWSGSLVHIEYVLIHGMGIESCKAYWTSATPICWKSDQPCARKLISHHGDPWSILELPWIVLDWRYPEINQGPIPFTQRRLFFHLSHSRRCWCCFFQRLRRHRRTEPWTQSVLNSSGSISRFHHQPWIARGDHGYITTIRIWRCENHDHQAYNKCLRYKVILSARMGILRCECMCIYIYTHTRTYTYNSFMHYTYYNTVICCIFVSPTKSSTTSSQVTMWGFP